MVIAAYGCEPSWRRAAVAWMSAVLLRGYGGDESMIDGLRTYGVAAAGGAAGPGDRDPPAVVGAGAGAVVAGDAAAAGAGGQPGHGAERHAVAAWQQPASASA
uniref:Uncharacterized protein n=1 Tax=Zea mays TaxID=4577 RepID=A0A804LTC7_MAIZE